MWGRFGILRGRSWPSRRGKRPGRGATSAARSTGSRSRAFRSVRPVGSRSSRTACARTARRTRAARSSRSGSRLRSADRMTIRVAVDALGGDRAPEEIVAGAAAAASGDDRAGPLRPPGPRHARARAGRDRLRDRDGRVPRGRRPLQARLVARPRREGGRRRGGRPRSSPRGAPVRCSRRRSSTSGVSPGRSARRSLS